MTADRNPRPISGEIMTGGGVPSRPAVGTRQDEVVDAEFETVEASGSRDAATAPLRMTSAPEAVSVAGMESLRMSGEDSAASARGGPLFWVFGMVLVVAAFWVSGGHALVRGMPFLQEPVAAIEPTGLRIANLKTRIDETTGRAFLVVDGEAVNESSAPAVMPRIEISVVGSDGGMTRYFMGTRGRTLPPGGRLAFSGRLKAPIEGLDRVTAAFAEEEPN